MDDYQAIAIYAAFAFVLFGIALIWHRYRVFLQKMFHLNYRSHSESSDSKPVHHT
jgi:hypothetical protein